MNNSKIVSAVCAGLVGITATAVAKNHPLPTPPTNAAFVAFGRDADGDGNLAPEETALRVGVDCGVPLWNGHLARSTGQPTWNGHLARSTGDPTRINSWLPRGLDVGCNGPPIDFGRSKVYTSQCRYGH